MTAADPYPRRDHSTVGQEQVQLSATRPVRVQRLPVLRPVSPHDHAFSEICLVVSGSGRHLRAGHEDQLQRGTALVVPPGPVHAFDRLQDLQVVNIYFLPEWFLWDIALLRQQSGLLPLFFGPHLFPHLNLGRISVFHLSPAELEACEHELRDLENDSLLQTPSPLFIRGAFAKFLVTLSRAAVRDEGFVPDFNFHPQVWHALEWMDSLLQSGGKLDVTSLARQAGYSADGFARAFKSATGLSPTEYFSWRRAQRAGHLLLRTDQSIGEVASQLGFADSAHLTRQFTRWKGCSPRDFRRKFGSDVPS